MKIFCLMFSGKSVSEKIADVLLENAHVMLEEETGWQKVKGKDYDGEITTEFEHVSFAGVVGIVFDAIMMTPQGETTVRFVVRDKDLDGIEKGKWFTPSQRTTKISPTRRIPKASDN